MKIALGQLEVKSGRCEDNFIAIEKMVQKAKQQKADIIVFPEMCISGYLLADKWLDDEYCKYVDSFNERIKDLADEIGIVFGNLYFQEIQGIKHGRDGRKARYNAALFAYQKQWVPKRNGFLNGIHIKHLNPDYRLFEDSRYFLSGMEVSKRITMDEETMLSPFVFKKEGKTYFIALEVCEDLWSADYGVDVTQVYAKQSVDCILNVSSSPWTIGKEKARDKRLQEHAKHLQEAMVEVVYVNACGMQNTGKNIVLFDGGSTVYHRDGSVALQLNDGFQEEIQLYDFEKKPTYKENKTENKVLEALLFALQSFDAQMFPFHPKWIIGLSGGIDSCINAALLVKALGKERVIGYNLASTYNSQTTKDNATMVAQALGMEIRGGSIEEVNEATLRTMHAYGYDKEYPSLVYENIQARIRGHLLSTFASIEGGVVINNGNKVEVALGYCTLYGDCIGALSLLGDLTKEQCFVLAKQINAMYGCEVISNTLIPEVEGTNIHWEMPPSAELKEAQLDPMKWFYHDYLISYLTQYPTGNIETFMQSYLDDRIYEEGVGKWIIHYGLDDPTSFIEDLEWVLKTMANAVFKRIQSPPICVVSRGAFGSDYRESQLGFLQTARYQQLKEDILKKKKSH